MSVRTFCGIATAWLVACSPALAEHPIADNPFRAEPVDAGWEEVDFGSGPYYDANVKLAQSTSSRSNSRGSSQTAARSSRTSRVPYMVGDQSTGLNGSLYFDGVDISEIEHPIFAGNRHNVAESNTAIPGDRLLFNYRHFHNVYQTNVLGETNTTDVERFDVGFEKAMCDGIFSAEVRAPMIRQLNSDISVLDNPTGSSGIPISDRSGEFGNLAATFKVLLCSRANYAFTTGVAVNMPTADDARINQNFVNPDLVISQTPSVGTTAPTNLSMTSHFDNDTVNLIPYFAWQLRPTDRLFHQGFLQIDAPLSRSGAEVAVSGTITPDTLDFDDTTFAVSEVGELDQQTLLRLNLGFGYWICQGGPGDSLRGVAGLFEVHYTATLDDANPFVVPVTTVLSNDPSIDDVPINLVAGHVFNDIEQVNLSTGLALDYGGVLITNGFIVPVTENENRSFNFEYNLQVHKRF